MKKSAFISDVFFTSFVVFLLTLCLFRYLQIKLVLAVVLSVVCGVLAGCSFAAVLQTKRKNFFLKKSDELEKDKFLLHLALLSDEEKTKLFLRYLSVREQAKRFARLQIYTQTAFYFLRFSITPVTADEVARLARFKTGKPKILLCAQIEATAAALCEKLGVEVRTGREIYKAFKTENLLPQRYLADGAPTKKRRLRLWFSKRNGKSFLYCGALILLTSFFTPFAYYYLIFGSILVIGAVVVRVFGYE